MIINVDNVESNSVKNCMKQDLPLSMYLEINGIACKIHNIMQYKRKINTKSYNIRLKRPTISSKDILN